MKTTTVTTLTLIISLLMLIGLIVLFILMHPPPHYPPKTPKAELSIERESDYIITIESIDFIVPSTKVEFRVYYKNGGSVLNVGANITDSSEYSERFSIANIEPDDHRENITYYDSDNNGNLSAGDYFILETDWDGSIIDGNGDGNFTNDGPINDQQVFVLAYKPTGNSIGKVNIEVP